MSEVKAGPSRNPERTCARCNDDCHARVISLERALAEANYRIGVLSAPRGGAQVLEAELLARSETAKPDERSAAALNALKGWYKFIGSIDKITTDASYHSEPLKVLFAACDVLWGKKSALNPAAAWPFPTGPERPRE